MQANSASGRSSEDPKRRLKTGVREIRLPGRRNATGRPKISTSTKISVCSVCHTERAKYTCPQCHAGSCSLKCYKSHGKQCTETFYEQEVRKEMKEQKLSRASRESTIAALQRNREALAKEPLPAIPDGPARITRSDAIDDGGEKERGEAEVEGDAEAEVLRRRLQQMAVKEDFDPSKLDPETERKFRKMAAQGRLAGLLKPWVPWWIVEEEETKKTAEAEVRGWRFLMPVAPRVTDPSGWPNRGLSSDAPSLKLLSLRTEGGFRVTHEVDIPSLAAMRAPRPSEKLDVNLLDLLYAYAFTKRLYNGEWDHDRKGAGAIVFAVSEVLAKNTTHDRVAGALQASVENARRVPGASRAFALSVLRDTSQLLCHHTLTVSRFSPYSPLFIVAVGKPHPEFPFSRQFQHFASSSSQIYFLFFCSFCLVSSFVLHAA